MKKNLLALLFLSPLFALSQEIPFVVFNEINCDNPGGPDTQEFLELYGTANVSLDSLVIVFFDGGVGVSYSAIDLDGYALNENGFFVIGDANTVNVDIVIGNSSFQNGQDGVALYNADATDFPNSSAPTTLDLIEAAVYGTGDATATNLITGLGLDILIPGYTQLDETAQQAGNDLSLSRLPDGGNAFETTSFVLQEVTPGTWNQPLCLAGNITTAALAESFTMCDNELSHIEYFLQDVSAYGDSSGFVVTDINDQIIEVLSADSFEFAGLNAGMYFVYSFSYNGILQTSTTNSGLPFSGILAGNCVSFSDNRISVEITVCGGCIGGQITDASDNNTLSLCAGVSNVISMTTTSTSTNADYLYVVADAGNLVANTFVQTFDAGTLTPGNYSIIGISYVGTIDPLLIATGADAALIVASTCQEFSDNTYTVDVFSCNITTPCGVVFISEYLEGNNGTKALELFNPSLSPIDLNGYALMNYANGALTPTNTLALTGTLEPLGTMVIANPGTGTGNGQADPVVLALADVTDLIANFSGNDAIELRLNDVVIDVIGVVGEDPGNQSGWPVAEGSTRNFDLVRKTAVQSPVEVWNVNSTQWDVYTNTDYTHLGIHSFNTCSSEVLAGFVSANMSVNENDGTITAQIQGINVSAPVTVDVSVSGGSADGSDFVINGAVNFIYDGTNNTQFISIDITDDIELENDETIILTLSSVDNITWLTQNITITILANDPNCDGGSIALLAGQGPVDQCSDLPNTPIDVVATTTMPLANYVYVITNSTNTIVEIVSSSPIDLDANGVGTFRIWGLSYTGTLDANSILAGASALNILSDSCATLSSNFITVIRTACTITGCDAGDVVLSDGTASISICQGAATILSPNNSGSSVDDLYDYFLTDDANNIVLQINGDLTTTDLAIGAYRIFGVSHQGILDGTTTTAGFPVTGILSNGCAELSANAIEINIFDCTSIPTCSIAYFSEFLEDSQSDKAFEIYNPTDGDIDLADYVVHMYSNGATTPSFVLQCEGILASHDVYVVVSSGNGQNPTDPAILAVADTLHEVATFSGNDALELVFQGAIVDLIGVIGEDPGNQGWLLGNTGTANHDLVRRPEVNAPNPDWSIVSGQWFSFEPTDYTHLGSHVANPCEVLNLPQAGFTIVASTIDENAGIIQVDVQGFNIVNPSTVEILVSGTAINGLDYNLSLPVTLNFAAGNSTQFFTIEILTDLITETDETIILNLTSLQITDWINTESVITISDVVGVNEYSAGSLKLYPNPANDHLNISTEQVSQSWIIRDMSGRMILSGNNNSGKKHFNIETSTLIQGQYSLELKSNDKVEIKRFVVMR